MASLASGLNGGNSLSSLLRNVDPGLWELVADSGNSGEHAEGGRGAEGDNGAGGERLSDARLGGAASLARQQSYGTAAASALVGRHHLPRASAHGHPQPDKAGGAADAAWRCCDGSHPPNCQRCGCAFLVCSAAPRPALTRAGL